MSRVYSLKTNFKWMFIANILFAFCQWLILISIAKLGDKELVGIYTLGLAITAPIMIFSNLQLRAIQATDAQNENEFRDFFSLRTIFVFLGLIIIFLIIFWSNYKFETKVIIFLIGLSKAVEGMSDIIYGYLQKKEDMQKIAVSLMLRGFFSVSLFSVTLYVTGNLVWATMFSTLAWLIVFLFYDLQSLKKYSVDFFFTKKIDELKSLFLTAIPLGLVTMLGSLNTNIPRYIIERELSLEVLGVFGAVSYILVGANQFTKSISQTVSPRLAKYYAQSDRKSFLKLFNKVLFINVILGIVGFLIVMIFGKEILTIAYTSEYASYHKLFLWTMVLSCTLYITNVLGVAVTSMRLFAKQLPIHILKLILVTITSIIFIRRFGVEGAVWSLLISTIVTIYFYMKLFNRGYKRIGEKSNE